MKDQKTIINIDKKNRSKQADDLMETFLRKENKGFEYFTTISLKNKQLWEII